MSLRLRRGLVVAAMGLLYLLHQDHWLADNVEALFGVDPGLVLTGSAAAIVFAFIVRFIVSLGTRARVTSTDRAATTALDRPVI